ncbi:uncharacterized protein LOC101851875 [Aplysia californica]|uniref:Uncharacterized protein LOC101851875 n=1 Tax=Aplysia californica TaxID=6500 RepID=A0ABM1A2Q1_APLCA|nr:uncharacterized protein LOC101851875 [Aplysia californica]
MGRLLYLELLLWLLLLSPGSRGDEGQPLHQLFASLSRLEEKVARAEERLVEISRHSMLQQFGVEESSVLAPVDDLSFRVPRGKALEEMSHKTGARFTLFDGDVPGFQAFSKLDRLFSHVPGQDNRPGQLSQPEFGQPMYSTDPQRKDLPLNLGYYHRAFRFGKPGAMGLTGAKEL